jgi:hypothetical protein
MIYMVTHNAKIHKVIRTEKGHLVRLTLGRPLNILQSKRSPTNLQLAPYYEATYFHGKVFKERFLRKCCDRVCVDSFGRLVLVEGLVKGRKGKTRDNKKARVQ